MNDGPTTPAETVARHAPLHVVALLPEPETVASCLQSAIAAAGPLPATVTAVHVGFDPRHALVSAEEIVIQQLRDRDEGTAAQRLARVAAAFEAWVSETPEAPPVEWRNDEGDVRASVVDEARDADLVVIGRPIHLDARDALHSALFRVHRLVLVAPRSPRAGGREIGRHMVVGWKPGDPARHAVEAARPWLTRAERVTVLCVARAGVEPYDRSARALFAALGVPADVVPLKRDARSVGDQLLAEATRIGGDSLLIGAYKHGVLWEALLGGVTRDVLARAEIPVFMMR